MRGPHRSRRAGGAGRDHHAGEIEVSRTLTALAAKNRPAGAGPFFLGAGAGMLNVYRTVTGIGHAIGYEKLDRAPKAGAEGQGPAPKPGAGRDESGK